MLGWEYPPHISGGLGTACEGLTTALSRLGADIVFVVPELFGGERAPHMSIIEPRQGRSSTESRPVTLERTKKTSVASVTSVTRVTVPSFLRPYLDPDSFKDFVDYYRTRAELRSVRADPLRVVERMNELKIEDDEDDSVAGAPEDRYSGDIFEEVARYASDLVMLLSQERFDVIHAHDWMTFPAGVALSRITGKPLVVHVHSLEFDRSGMGMNPQINEIERFGIENAQKVIAVSYYTKSIICQQHGVPDDKIVVVHNGVYPKKLIQSYKGDHRLPSKIVLFLGRITFQKGPDYFVEAAARVIPHVPDVLFVMAGSGDMLPRMRQRVQELDLEDHFAFTGFLRGEEVEQMFSVADLYVMPSVSEPFGISALEAISCETPVIISRQSGVAEVLAHALKVDFWDLDRLADLMVNALLHDELRADMVSMAREEIRRIHWDAAALKVIETYRAVRS